MKKVIDGITYNTETSTALATAEYRTNDDHDVQSTLYQTRGGAFFTLEVETWGVRDDYSRVGWSERSRATVTPLSIDNAHKWVLEGEVELLPAGEKLFTDLPEAEADTVGGATIYLRVPAALKQRIERVARKTNQSVNVWAMRCLEGCAGTGAAE